MQSCTLISRKGDKPYSPFLACNIQRQRHTSPPATPLGGGLDHRPDAKTRGQVKSYSKPFDKLKIDGTGLPPIGNSRKLQLKWSVWASTDHGNSEPSSKKIKEMNVLNSGEYTPHISKLRLMIKFGEPDLNPIFLLLRLPKEAMLQLEDKLSKINLPCKVNQSLVDEFYKDINTMVANTRMIIHQLD